jgi:hypothetical protein
LNDICHTYYLHVLLLHADILIQVWKSSDALSFGNGH